MIGPVKKSSIGFGALCGTLAMVCCLYQPAFGYRRAVQSKDNVKNKLYPRKERFELSVPNLGIILNQSYVQTQLLNAGLVYHLSSEWGVGLDFSMALNQDRPERICVESFYNDPDNQLGDPCGDVGALEELGPRGVGAGNRNANYGPAYVPIREIGNIISLSAVWVPVYGKQLVLKSSTSYFDLYFEFGGALVSSTYYPKMSTLLNGKPSRGQANADGSLPEIGAEPDEAYAYGEEGRPGAESQSHVAINLGIGQKFHFARKFHVKLYLRNMTLLGTPNSFDNLFALFGGVGMRF